MRLLNCTSCHDVLRLYARARKCACGASRGKIVEGTAFHTGPSRVLAIAPAGYGGTMRDPSLSPAVSVLAWPERQLLRSRKIRHVAALPASTAPLEETAPEASVREALEGMEEEGLEVAANVSPSPSASMVGRIPGVQVYEEIPDEEWHRMTPASGEAAGLTLVWRGFGFDLEGRPCYVATHQAEDGRRRSTVVLVDEDPTLAPELVHDARARLEAARAQGVETVTLVDDTGAAAVLFVRQLHEVSLERAASR